MSDKVLLSHGDGGLKTNELIKNVFLNAYGDAGCKSTDDAFVFSHECEKLAYTTDSFVVKPLFFRGGDIGKLSVCGTINDLVTAGAKPLYISAGFVIEAGFEMDALQRIAASMAKVCREADVKIVTGDTKVVEKGSLDGLFINTSGIGVVSACFFPGTVEPGDEIIITGTIAEHGTAILLDRYELSMETEIVSDCASLHGLIHDLGEDLQYVKRMKDPTRGGLGTILNEITEMVEYNAELIERDIPISKQVAAVGEILGIDPLYLACEGRMVLIVQKGFADKILKLLRKFHYGKNAAVIGRFTTDKQRLVYSKTVIGGKRLIPVLETQGVPRIC